jgi:dTDP-4-dehydrorhamnose 3,5-epimerase
MDGPLIDGVLLTPLREIPTEGGNVYHAMKAHDPGYIGFGEAYFSTVECGAVKGWKRHARMTLNLIVPIGRIRFVLLDERAGSPSRGRFSDVTIGRPKRYARLTVPPMVWMAFAGAAADTSWLLNVADLAHDPNEVERRTLEDIAYVWK